jgi:hypothetical protein
MPDLSLSTLLVSAFSLSVAAWAWLMRRWVTKVDSLHKDVELLRTQAAVRDERITHLVGAIETLRKTVQDQSATVGVIANAVDKVWITLEAKGLIQPRPSDEVLRGVAKSRK